MFQIKVGEPYWKTTVQTDKNIVRPFTVLRPNSDVMHQSVHLAIFSRSGRDTSISAELFVELLL